MDAVFSGQAGTLAFLQGADVRVHRQSGLEFSISREGLSYLFEGCNDVVLLLGTTEEIAREQYENAWEADRSLRLTLIAIDPEEDPDLRKEAADYLEPILESVSARTFVENELYAHLLPVEADLDFIHDKWPHAQRMLQDVLSQQSVIRAYRDAWDRLGPEFFEKLEKADFEERAIRRGAFRVLASADLRGLDRNVAILECYKALHSLPNGRSIVSEWTKEFLRKGSKPIVLPEENDDYVIPVEPDLGPVFAFAAYTNAIQQQKAIIEKMRIGGTALARKYAEQLVASQLRSSGAEYAAKSLCNLAQKAKYLGLFSLQLEWAKQAVDVYPEDAWARGQYADALLEFYRLDEALAELDQCELYGDAEFATVARARILRLQGRLDEALAAFRAARRRFGGDRVVYAWSGSAETLRDMWKFDEALEEYSAAIRQFPEAQQLRCGYAAVLADLGRLDEALAAYSLPQCGEDLVAMNGKASVLRDNGSVEEALALVGRAIELFPTDPVSRCLQADILRIKGEFEAALDAYSGVKANSPSVSVAFTGYAEVLRDMRRIPEAVAAYEEAVRLFPFEQRVANGYANIRKVNDELAASLALYEGNVSRFPYSLVAKVGRADLLKRLRAYDDALAAYDEIISIWPGYASARNGKAAILVALNRFEAAKELLSDTPPASRDDWIAWHVRGMILVRQERFDEAIKHFEFGAKNTPFVRERRYFDRAMSVAKMRKGKFKEAVEVLEGSGGGISNVLRFHALAGAGDTDRANRYFVELATKCPSQLIELRDAIAARFGFADQISHHHNDNWIFDRETEALLQEAA
jgi:tetratricopeptide (TPR) repeat protein